MKKMRFVDKYGGDCVSTHSGEADCFAAKEFHLRRKFAVKIVYLHRKTILEYGYLSCFYQIIGT